MAATAADASGLIFPIGGAKAQSMAGAWIAQGDDLSAFDHNPAQLSRQDKIAIEFHYFAFHYNASFDPDPVVGLGDGPRASNSGNFVNHIPNFYAAFPIGEKLVLGGGLFTPYGPRQTFTDDGPQRYQVQQTRVSLVWGTVAAAYSPVSAFTISASLDVGYPWVTQKMAIPLVAGMRTLEGQIVVDGTGKPVPRAKIGLLAQLTDELSLGAVFAHGVDLSVEGTLEVEMPAVGFTADNASDQVIATQRYPLEARLGVGWVDEKWRSEVAVRYFNFSEYTAQSVDLKNNRIGAFEFEDIVIDKDYRNAFAVQVGGGFRPIEGHEIRAGYGFDLGASKDTTASLTDYDANRHIVGLGYGLDFGKFYGNLGYTRVIFQERHITTSNIQPIAILGDPPTLHNGVYNWSVNMFGINAGVRF